MRNTRGANLTQFLKWSSNLDNTFHSLCFKFLGVNYIKLTGIACFTLPFSCCHFQQWTGNLPSLLKAAEIQDSFIDKQPTKKSPPNPTKAHNKKSQTQLHLCSLPQAVLNSFQQAFCIYNISAFTFTNFFFLAGSHDVTPLYF